MQWKYLDINETKTRCHSNRGQVQADQLDRPNRTGPAEQALSESKSQQQSILRTTSRGPKALEAVTNTKASRPRNGPTYVHGEASNKIFNTETCSRRQLRNIFSTTRWRLRSTSGCESLN